MQKSQKKHVRSRVGAYLAEMSAALVFIIPLVILAVFLAAEVAEVYFIKQAVTDCAEKAARKLAIEYANNPEGVVNNPSSQFADIRYMNVVNSPSQFSVPAGSAGWNTSSHPRTVSVDVTFYPGKYGCPDVITFGQWSSISTRCTQSLEGY